MGSHDGDRWKSDFSIGVEAGVLSPQVYAGGVGRGAESPKVYPPGTERRFGRASSQQTVSCNLVSGVKTERKGVYIPVLWWLLSWLLCCGYFSVWCIPSNKGYPRRHTAGVGE